MTRIKWEGAGTPLPDGHRIFETHDNGHGEASWAIADDSGHYPEGTDDGVLWLDPSRCLLVDKDESFDPPREYIAIPLVDSDGKRTRTHSNAATILFLSRFLRWTIEDKVHGRYFNAK